MDNRKLVELAVEAAGNAYAPYSGFCVGAALLTESGKVYCGCNIENSSFGATSCAERTAFFKAISEGERKFLRLAIVGGKEEDYSMPCVPCGICRQVISEFCDGNFQIVLLKDDEVIVYTLEELLPMSFSL